jgi:uncharacterized cupredoxin-like copper-binding protein
MCVNARLRRAAAFAGVAAMLLVACGDGETIATPAAGAQVEVAVEVVAVDFEFRDLPATVPAGTRFTLTNQAPSELHEIVAVRLPDDEERSVADLFELPPNELASMMATGGPDLVILAPPRGEAVVAVGDGTLTEPGRYAFMCFIPTGVDPDAYLAAAAASEGGPPRLEGGPPHVAHGMFAEVLVE